MKARYFDTDDKIAALATPFSESALAVVRTSGNGAVEAAAACFEPAEALCSSPHGKLIHGTFVHPVTRAVLDDVVVGVYRPPGGFTGEESVEVFCHGSLPGIGSILEALRAAGFREALPGEFTFRAFLNGKIDLTQAEAVQELVGAKSELAHHYALNRLSGALQERIHALKHQVLDILAVLEVQLDYTDDEIEEETDLPVSLMGQTAEELRNLASTYQAGKIYRDGARVVIAGKTNSGKSSLFNLFLKEDRSIVSDIHGTTRDYIESWISVEGIPVKLYDTAGFRTVTNDRIEEEGMKRSREVQEHAHLVLYLFDAEEKLCGDELETYRRCLNDDRYVLVWSKVDSPKALKAPGHTMPVSARTASGFRELEAEMVRRLVGYRRGDSQEVLVDALRQKELLDRAAEAMDEAVSAAEGGMSVDVIAPDVQDALNALGELTGEVTTEDILERIFSEFCVGK